jgi:radical SAM protein with 4Fe4S-binding SPASM domain
MQTINYLKKAQFRGLRLSMTLSRANSDQLLPVAQLARKLDLELGIVPAHASNVHFFAAKIISPKLDVLLPQLDVFIIQLLRSGSPKLWLRAHFAHRVGQYITGSLPAFSCSAGDDFFFLQADGPIYPCNICSGPMGNIIEDDFAALWSSTTASDIRTELRKCDRRCWMVCTARSYYLAHPLKILLWILSHKFRAHFQPLSNHAGQG